MFSLCLYFLQNLKYNTVDAFSPRAPEPGCLLHSLVGKKLYYMTDFLVFIKKKTVYNLSALLAKKKNCKTNKTTETCNLKIYRNHSFFGGALQFHIKTIKCIQSLLFF